MIRACATLAFLATTAFADGNEHTPFHPDPDHIWNRIHEAFYVRVGADGTKYTAEVLDPPLAPKTIFPLTPPAHQTIIAMLDEFLATDAATKISDPLKRAIFQRDIWAVFDWTAKPVAWYSKAGRTYPEKRRALQVRLAKMIQQVALTREEIEALPDNYEVASSSGLFPQAYDPAMPRAAFLPPGLTQSPEPWLQLSGMKAPEHNEVSMGRSVFLIFCLFPDEPGYLHRLRDFSAPWEFSTYYQKFPSGGGSVYIVNRKLPQFPAGSQFILMRRTLLVDTSGTLVLSPLTESVQIRVYTTEPTLGIPSHDFFQEAYAFELDRDALFSEKSGGLRVIADDEPSLTSVPFGLWPNDTDPIEADDSEARERFEGMPRMFSCRVCHSGSGINSVRFYTGHLTMRQQRPPRLNLTHPDKTSGTRRTMRWKERQYSWGLLQGLWAKQ